MLLDEKEKLRFIEYLEITAENCKGIAEQMSKAGGTVMEQLEKRERTKAAACLLIANDLRNSEPTTIG